MCSCRQHTLPNSNRVAAGRQFERRAADFFEQQGFEILERNWHAGKREIDLIVRRDNLIVFVEVKAARTNRFGHPAEWVDERKVTHLIKAAQQYLVQHEISGCDLRFDVVTFSGGQLEHYPGAFTADET